MRFACHAEAGRAEDTDWPLISALYAQLAALAGNQREANLLKRRAAEAADAASSERNHDS